ncbi:peptidase S41 [Candidatus Roizmanbacteria bacterium CG11_big_fil_rev_8_21_14_0_20_36_8]|uniref:Peptidase S41 n=2 Tax=Candidatus Roizmaniibacteriota TaxID=1752723 RepID=A0A2M6IUV6_9BACT|nr:MAG: peptidase S41 [Candidatus Roizmanbacteria bacterium CG11_big_fil_rev_8_21_14_0_20_36_8]PIZ65904.1 MAG: peptidase S41 [Candidatus Roizmanbacteria bacterium CG_4_10_14_0_2_um_filter_36_9]
MLYTPKKFTDFLLIFAVSVFLFGSGYKFAEWKIKKNVMNSYSQTIFNATNSVAKNEEGEVVDFSLFWDTWSEVEKKYVDKDKVIAQKMYYGAIKGLVASLEDPYTFFLTPDENQQSKSDLGGKFEGIGAQLGLKNNSIVVIAPLKDSPAQTAGLKTGDYIIKVDGKSTEGWTLYETVSKIRGPKDSQVKLTVLRDAAEKEISITRMEIKVPSIELTYEPLNKNKVAVIKINQFGDTTNDEWDKAAKTVSDKWKNGEISGLVLDVRGNPGGYLDSAVYIASEFLEKGKTVVKQEATTSNDRVYAVKRNGVLLDIPMTVLINEGSASASEILAGALRDYKRAKLIGKKSFGKGSVQEALDLQKGAGLHVTVAKWILPNGSWIHRVGLEPDIEVELVVAEGNTVTTETDNQLQEAINNLVN